jgi:hypothetical protein
MDLYVKDHHGLVHKKLAGENTTANTDRLERLPTLLEGYEQWGK